MFHFIFFLIDDLDIMGLDIPLEPLDLAGDLLAGILDFIFIFIKRVF